jgi:hypothetical protein
MHADKPLFAFAVVLSLSLMSCSDHVGLEAQQSIADSTNAVQGRPDLEVRTSAGITGFTSAVQQADGSIITYDRISGIGSVDAEEIVIEGELAPGNSPGCIDFGGNVTLNANATLLTEIGGTIVCNEYDRISVANQLTINGATLQVELISPYIPSEGQRFDVLDWGSISGSFGFIDLSTAVLPGNLFWDTSRLHTTGELVVGSPTDSDGDGIEDYRDNCTLRSNPGQRDTDGDGYGNFCDPDFNNDLIVNFADLAYMKSNFFSTYANADLNGDGIVNFADLAIIKQMFFKSPGPSGLVP